MGRRERLGAGLRPLGIALLLSGGISAGMKALGVASPWPLGVLVAGVGLGLLFAAFTVLRVRPVSLPNAAWALDRIAGAQERGLVAATVEGPIGAEAAWASGRVDPPHVDLLPPRGLALVLGGVLAVTLALLVPARDVPGPPDTAVQKTEAAAGTGAAGDLVRSEEAAADDAEKARAAAAVRDALKLGPLAASDPTRLAERLADDAARDAALEAAGDDGELAALLGEGASAERLARALAEGADAETEALEARRRAAALRAGGSFLTVPPDRRELVDSYTWHLNALELGAREGGR